MREMRSVKLAKEIRSYSEQIFFGLNARQLLFSILTVLSSGFVYFRYGSVLSSSTIGWVCILVSAPWAFLGFVKFQGMPAERVVVTIFRYLFSMKRLPYKSRNLYYECYMAMAAEDRKGRKQSEVVKNDQCA